MGIKVTVTRQKKDAFEISLSGRLDSDSYSQAEATVTSILSSEPKVIIFNMSELNYISSMGLRVIMMTRKKLEAAGGTVVMTNLQPQIAKVFEIAAVLPKQVIFASIEEADAYLDAMQKKVLEK